MGRSIVQNQACMTFPTHNSRDDRFTRIKSPLSLEGQEFCLTANFSFFQGINFLTDWLPKSMFTGRVSGSPVCGIALLLFQFSGSSKRGPCHPHPTPFSEIGSEVNFLSSRPGPLCFRKIVFFPPPGPLVQSIFTENN